MRLSRIVALAAVPILAFACGGAGQTSVGSDAGHGEASVTDARLPDARPFDTGREEGSPDAMSVDGDSSDAKAPTNNVAPVVVNAGPPKSGSFDVPFISVTLCVPGTTNCQTLDYVSVDTGSSGLRVLSSALSGSLALPHETATDGNALVECYTFDDGYVWGPVELADIRIAGELAAKVPIQVIGDPAFSTVPTACSSTGPSEGTVMSFGAYGILGINQMIPDCGDYCSNTKDVQPGAYYGCSGTACTAVAVSNADQVPNPIASFATDNNGAVLELPSIPADGAPTVTGSLIFGIGTEANNALGKASILTVDGNGNFTTIFDGNTLPQSYLDSGTNYLSFADSSIPHCKASSSGGGYFCPTSTLSLTAENQGRNLVTSTVSFTVANTDTLFAHASYTAFDDVAGPGGGKVTFDWGLPFFIGRSVFVALDGAATPGGKGPYFAY
jgi:hypothetical protein